jgi:hypothetical protein
MEMAQLLFCGRPIKNLMKRLNSTLLGQMTTFCVIILALCFVQSIRDAGKHRHHHDDGHADGLKDKLFHDNKRLRAERNSYLSFGSLFLALVLSQLWVLLNRVIDLVRHY